MSRSDDLIYLLERAKQERLQAARSTDLSARSVHLAMARNYERRAQVQAPLPDITEQSVRHAG